MLTAQTPKPILVKSPDGTIVFSVANVSGKLSYTIAVGLHTIIEPSALGLAVNGVDISDAATAGKVTGVKRINELYPTRGVHSLAVNKCTDATIEFDVFRIQVRVYNDGVAFRYMINKNNSSLIEREYTSFNIPAGSIIWSQSNIKYYEGAYSAKQIDTLKTGVAIGPPFTIELPGDAGYAAITEGGLTDFSGMSLTVQTKRSLQVTLAGVTIKKGLVETPWRIIQVGKNLNTLVNCDIVSNVSQEHDRKLFPKGLNTDWIKPGRSVWSWLSNTRAITLENMKHFSDLAAELGFEYNLVDEGWGNWKDSINKRDHWDMMKELVDYSATKGVKIWVWKAYPDRKGIAGLKHPAERLAFFKKCKEIGIAGLKIDFFDNESQEIIQFYQTALKDAATYRLMINFHGSNKPTGETRTWPNEMTREAIRGMENRPPWAENNTILPFTRFLAGHADYTPVHFGARMGEVSWAQHVASMIVFTSPFLCVGADPQSILDNPCKTMIQQIPTVWDETIVLPQSKIGELVVYARRKGSTWFVAAMSCSNEIKTIELNLSFLKGNYRLSSVTDKRGQQANAKVENSKLFTDARISVTLNAKGGYAAMFEKVK